MRISAYFQSLALASLTIVFSASYASPTNSNSQQPSAKPVQSENAEEDLNKSFDLFANKPKAQAFLTFLSFENDLVK